MFKKLLVAAIVLVTVVVAGLYLVLGNLPKIVRSEIEAQGSRALGVAVRVRDAEKQGDDPEPMIKLTGVTIANPSGFVGDVAIAIQDVWIRYDARPNQPAGRIVVREVIAAGVVVNYVGETGANNLETLQRNAIAAARDGAKRREQETPKLVVDSFSSRGGKLNITHKAVATSMNVTMPPVGTGSIGRRENGAVAADVAQRLLGAIVAEAMRSTVAEVQNALAGRPPSRPQ